MAAALHPDLMPPCANWCVVWNCCSGRCRLPAGMRAGTSASLGILGHHAIASFHEPDVAGAAAQHFQPQEGVWQSAVKITEILALVMVGLARFCIDSDSAGIAGHRLHGRAETHHLFNDHLLRGRHYVSLNLNHVLTRLEQCCPIPFCVRISNFS